MVRILHFLAAFKRDEKGATAIEYGLIAALVAVVIIGGLTAVGGGLGDTLDFITGKLETAGE